MRKYSAIIIEPRQHIALSFVLENICKNLSDEWLVIIMHGINNIEFIDNIISNHLHKYRNRIAKINLFVDNLKLSEYNELLVSEYFYNKIPTEKFLVFQTDSMISEKNKELINNFLDYDYVGAPWKDLTDGNHKYSVGNGGFSFRDKNACLECIKNNKWDGCNEDMFFSKYITNKPSIDEAKMFSIETIYSDKSFGTHKPWFYFYEHQINNLSEQFDGLDQLMKLNYWEFYE
uniref:DUF5672 domain-containing protein n=1 Tax=viral metagenome TaxID=1070528 RepID=A0A6C0KTL5_9ZZZZ